MKTTRADRAKGRAKSERRAHRKAKGRDRRDGDGCRVRTLGGEMEPAFIEDLLASFREFDPAGPWSGVAARVLPVLKRRNHPFPPEAAPLQLRVPPGVWTGFGIDLGPAFSHVSQGLLDRWGIDQATLLASALENLARLAVEEPPVVDTLSFEGMEVIGIQGQGWGSSLILAPDLLRPILGATPRILLAPVRNTLLALAEDVEFALAADLWYAIAEGAHDELDVEPLRWTGSSVTLIGDEARGLAN